MKIVLSKNEVLQILAKSLLSDQSPIAIPEGTKIRDVSLSIGKGSTGEATFDLASADEIIESDDLNDEEEEEGEEEFDSQASAG